MIKASAVSSKWTRRSREEWRALLSGHARSGLSVEAYCRRDAISAASFYRWREVFEAKPAARGDEIGAGYGAHGAGFVELGTLVSARDLHDGGRVAQPSRRLDLRLDLEIGRAHV